jgi:hypothetical protein
VRHNKAKSVTITSVHITLHPSTSCCLSHPIPSHPIPPHPIISCHDSTNSIMSGKIPNMFFALQTTSHPIQITAHHNTTHRIVSDHMNHIMTLQCNAPHRNTSYQIVRHLLRPRNITSLNFMQYPDKFHQTAAYYTAVPKFRLHHKTPYQINNDKPYHSQITSARIPFHPISPPTQYSQAHAADK